MGRTRIDVAGLYAALDGAREARGASWRQLAKEIGVSPSLLFRLGNGYRPDADGFATLVTWLRLPAEMFMINEDDPEPGPSDEQRRPDLMAELAPLLRARPDLNDADVEYLEEVIRATLRRAQVLRQDSHVTDEPR